MDKLATYDIDEVRDPVRFLSGRRILGKNVMFLAWGLTRQMTDVESSPTGAYRTLVGDINVYNRQTKGLSVCCLSFSFDPLPVFHTVTALPLQLHSHTASMAQQKESEQALQTLFKDVLKIDRNTLEGRMLADVNAVSSPLANKMLGQIGLGKETTAPFALLDNGAGLGVVGAELQRLVDNTVLAKSSIICGDFSEAMVQATRRRAQREGWVNTEARVINAETTGFPDNHFDYVTMNIGAHVVPDSEAWLKGEFYPALPDPHHLPLLTRGRDYPHRQTRRDHGLHHLART